MIAPAEQTISLPGQVGTPAPGRASLPVELARAAGRVRSAMRAIRRAKARSRAASLEGLPLRAQAFALSRMMTEVCASHGVVVVTSGPVPCGPVVLVANHVGYLDPLVLGGAVPCLPIAKHEVASWPLIGSAGRRHGVMFVRRGDAWSGARALLAARRALAGGVSVLNFHEGTTTAGASVLRFQRGIFGLAARTRVSVVPVAIAYDDEDLAWTGDALFLPHYLRTLRRERTVARLRFGCAMTPSRYGSAASLAEEAQAVVAHLLAGT
jgi:1-acyl-sn-glycerol-3-phosphate acyltransferase